LSPIHFFRATGYPVAPTRRTELHADSLHVIHTANAEFTRANIRYGVMKELRIGYISNFIQSHGFSRMLK
jgi:hypothetical protein